MVKNLPAKAGDKRDAGSILGLGRSPVEGNGNPLQCSFREIPWTEKPCGQSPVGSQKSQTRLSD